MGRAGDRNYKGAWRNVLGWWIYLLSWLRWWFHRYMHMSKFIQLNILNMCSLLIKLFLFKYSGRIECLMATLIIREGLSKEMTLSWDPVDRRKQLSGSLEEHCRQRKKHVQRPQETRRRLACLRNRLIHCWWTSTKWD